MSDLLNILNDYLTTGYKQGAGSREQGAVSIVSNISENHQDKTSDKTQTPDPRPPTPETFEKIAEEINQCRNCPLHTGRTNTVPGEGCLTPLVMAIGEGPGEDEDITGRPFVGKAGQLLDKMLSSIGLSRNKNTYIANVVKCRPPNNRNPLPDETAACSGFLRKQILLLKPKFILILGKVAANTLFNNTDAIGKLRGKFFNLKIDNLTIPAIATYHPSALLRDESYKRPAWEDLKLLKSKLVDSC